MENKDLIQEELESMGVSKDSYTIEQNSKASDPNKAFIIRDNRTGEPLSYINELSFDKKDAFQRNTKYQQNINIVVNIAKIAGLNISTCEMKVFSKSGKTFVFKKAAENGIKIVDENGYKGNNYVVGGAEKLTKLQDENPDKGEQTAYTFLNNLNNYEAQIKFIEGLYDTIGLTGAMDMFDVRFNGNIFANKETGEIQLVDFDLIKENTFSVPELSDRGFVKDNKNPIVKEVQELYGATMSGNTQFLDNTAFFIQDIIGERKDGENFNISNTINQINEEIIKLKSDTSRENEEKNKEQIEKLEGYKKRFEELKNYKQEIAKSIIKISNAIDDRHNKLENKDKLSPKEKRELSYLKERHANIMKIFEQTGIGKEASKLYKEEHNGKEIEAYPETRHDLSSITYESKPKTAKKGNIKKQSNKEPNIETAKKVGKKGTKKKGEKDIISQKSDKEFSGLEDMGVNDGSTTHYAPSQLAQNSMDLLKK